MNIRSIDLNLLVALNALLEEKHVTRAANRINLSQPAMSRALARLRSLFNDSLLVKGTSGLSLTPRAIELYPTLQNILQEINYLITPQVLHPQDMQGEIIIATRDYELATILPKVISKVSSLAPHLTIQILPLIGDDLSALEHQKVDLVICGTEYQSATVHRHTLFYDEFICIKNKKNTFINNEIDLDDYISMKHCLVTISHYGFSFVDKLLKDKNLKRNISVRVPHFLAAVHIIMATNLIVTLPKRLGKLLEKENDIQLINPPFAIPSFPIFLYWHTRNQKNVLNKWLRELIKQCIE